MGLQGHEKRGGVGRTPGVPESTQKEDARVSGLPPQSSACSFFFPITTRVVGGPRSLLLFLGHPEGSSCLSLTRNFPVCLHPFFRTVPSLEVVTLCSEVYPTRFP